MFLIKDWMKATNEPADRQQDVKMEQWGVTDVLTHDRTGGREPDKTQGRDNKNLQREDHRRKDCYTDCDTYDNKSGFPPDCRVS